ncbi:hypothetical protein [Pseudomonas sp. URMO17WK12:I2]|uniref:hypothetical protein n=1 Tax=Pseudomonas sp. URMO17WK12:I2 TaxID=1261623 RepID=UPI000DB70FE3|nr:hypothetical protein [Pseudomonas sp. URMO17WK12:I2]PZW44392.1 hypothetical protein F469_02914 [Pseudomonas sp. URMO17WK12:I2]
MILDKFSEFIYEQSSLFFTKWRVSCFLVIVLLLTDIGFELLSKEFWFGSVAAAVDTFSDVLLLPLYVVVLIFALCFLVSPFLNRAFSLLVLGREYKRAESFILDIQDKVSKVSSDSLVQYRDRAVEGEAYIQRLKGLNESVICFSIFGVFMAIHNEVIFIYYSIVFVVPFLIFFSVQSIFSKYLNAIFFYKKLSENISTRRKNNT